MANSEKEINELIEIQKKDILIVEDLAKLLGLTKRTTQNRIYRGHAMPPSIQVGGKHRVWLKSTVMNWLQTNEKNTAYK